MKCIHCGTKLRNESNFCLGCGQPVNAKECYIEELRSSGRVLTRKTDKDSLEHIIDLTEKIFERTNENPDLKYDARAFFESYLPMIVDVLSRYKRVKGHKKESDKLRSVMDDMTEVLDTTEEAFELLLRELYENDITELKINIEALKAQIARDGLVKSPFNIKV